ncbi:MAG: glycosyltransferase [Deltaproteobacteria bacterium]|nr:glycosyltransferase [Deltaproteobacteria bacterium]
MHIAMLSPVAWRTPPRHYGPWESVVSLLTEGLIARGIDVTLFATGDSVTKGCLHWVCKKGYEEDEHSDPKVMESLHISELFDRAADFDLIHNHFDFLPLTYSGLVKTTVLTTIHGFSSPRILPAYKKYNGKAFYVSISEADRAPGLDYIKTIHHGIDLNEFSFNAEPQGNYLLFFGRIHPDKGAKEAIEIARRTDSKLIMAGIIQDEVYYEREVEPHLNGKDITYVGSVGPEKRDDLLRNAKMLLHPINFDEPFGLSVVEAMACGTPVIAFNRGSMAELIRDGVNGFLVTDLDEAVHAADRLGEIDRAHCRKFVEENFSVERMVDDYIKIYEEIIEKTKGNDRRPWGYYEVFADDSNHKVKRIVVYPGKRLSLQRHRRRSEHWHVIYGEGVVTLDDREIVLKAGESIDIPQGAVHRMENRGTEHMAFVEVQRGDYFGEDDIERLEDDFGRK